MLLSIPPQYTLSRTVLAALFLIFDTDIPTSYPVIGREPYPRVYSS